MFLNFVTEELISKLAPLMERDRAETRVAVAGSQLLGFVVARYVLKLPPIAAMSIAEAASVLGPTLDRYILGEVAWG